MSGALTGIRVVDLTHALAGPSCTQLLAHLGAEVIKIENPDGGDFTRNAHPYVFASFNRSKRSVVLDLKREEGREVLRTLIAGADVFIESQRPGLMTELGLGPEALRTINPRLIYAEFSAYGFEGPFADRRGVDAVVQAESGLAAAQGGVLGSLSFIDEAAGLTLAYAIVAALLGRERSNEPEHIRVNLLDVGAYLQSAPFAEYSVTGVMRQQSDIASRFPCVGVFDAADGPIYVAGYWDRDWASICAVIGRPEFADDERYATANDRRQRVDEVRQILNDGFGGQERRKLLDDLERHRVMAGTYASYGEVLASDQTIANNTFEQFSSAAGRPLTAPRPPFRFVDRNLPDGIAPPQLGADTDTVLREHGFDQASIDAMRERGIAGGSDTA